MSLYSLYFNRLFVLRQGCRGCREDPAHVQCIGASLLVLASQPCIHAGCRSFPGGCDEMSGYPMLEKRGVLALAGLTSKATQTLSSSALKGIVRWNTDEGKKQTSPTLGATSTVGKS